MGKYRKYAGICLLAAAVLWVAGLINDIQTLQKGLIRLHVVAASDTQEDQALKLRVRDAILQCMRDGLDDAADAEEAKAYLQEKLPLLEAAANRVLAEVGCTEKATLTLRTEAFPRRDYDTFSLPAGQYESLRVTIGAGTGKNWWCVAFPALCVGATVEEFEESALCAGFSDTLTAALAEQEGYELRFFLMDALGRLENFLHGG